MATIARVLVLSAEEVLPLGDGSGFDTLGALLGNDERESLTPLVQYLQTRVEPATNGTVSEVLALSEEEVLPLSEGATCQILRALLHRDQDASLSRPERYVSAKTEETFEPVAPTPVPGRPKAESHSKEPATAGTRS